MRTFAIDENGNIDVTGNKLVIIKDLDALVQYIEQKYSMAKGEYFLDKRLGIPYFENIFIKGVNAYNVETILKRVLISIEEVYEITSFEIDIDSAQRKLTVNFECNTQFGELTSEVII